MGYGGIIKTVVRVAASTVGGMVCGPPCAAIGSAIATGATGGSFKESLMAGATSFVGSTVSARLSSAAQDLASSSLAGHAGLSGLGSVGEFGSIAGATPVGATSGISVLGDALGGLTQTGISDIPVIGDVSDAIGSQFNVGNFGKVLTQGVDKIRSGADFLLGSGPDSLFDLGFDLAPLQINSAADLVAAGVGGLTELTLNQALNADLEGVDEVLAQKFNPQQIQILRDEARNALSQETFERLTGPEGVVNPFPGTPEGLAEFQNIIATGIERENIGLGPDITESQFRTVFDDPNLGQTILGEEEALRRRSFGQEIGQAFPGDPFQPLDEKIIDSIVQERQGPAQQQISRFGARGNLNPTGGQTANIFIQRQVPEARERIGEVGAGVLGGYERDVGEIRGRAEQQAGGYKLGEDLFDVTPFSEERRGLIEERQGTLGADVRGAIGSEPLFDVSGALRAGGRAQGVVSGQGQNQPLLDQIAARELGSISGRNRRSLGSRGSGAF
jgi:hypothetical protein